MKNKYLLSGFVGLIAGGVIALFFISNTVNTNNIGMMQMMGIGQNFYSPNTSNIDKHFIEQMIPHHEGAIDMAKLAQKRSTRKEMQTLSKNIIESQTKEIVQMQAWYKDWYKVNVPVDSGVDTGMGRGIMHGGMMGENTVDTKSLQDASDFDKAFLEEMIPHHQMAVMMAQMLLSGTDRPEMKQLAQEIIKAQEVEIEQMRGWLRDWSQ